MLDHLRALLRDRRAATAIEYGLIAALIAIAAITGIKGIAPQVSSTLGNAASGMKVS